MLGVSVPVMLFSAFCSNQSHLTLDKTNNWVNLTEGTMPFSENKPYRTSTCLKPRHQWRTKFTAPHGSENICRHREDKTASGVNLPHYGQEMESECKKWKRNAVESGNEVFTHLEKRKRIFREECLNSNVVKKSYKKTETVTHSNEKKSYFLQHSS